MSLAEVYHRNLEHRTHRAGWLRAAVLGANDGLVSIASLMVGIAAASAPDFLITAGMAGIVAGSMSMAVGEYVSVRSQNDIEESDRLLEIAHLKADPDMELLELTHIYIDRGLTPDLANQVALAMHEKDALAAHLRDELGQHPHSKAKPLQAAIASATSFAIGGVIPFAGAFAPSPGTKVASIVAFALLGLLITGIVSAKISGSAILRPTVRVLLGGSLGMAITAGIGSLFKASGI